jgi:hypothetical protein
MFFVLGRALMFIEKYPEVIKHMTEGLKTYLNHP